MNVYIDTSVILGAASNPSDPDCQRLIQAVGDGRLSGVISCEVLQELLHVASWSHARELGLTLVEATGHLFPQPLPVTSDMVAQSLALMRSRPRLGMRVAIHAGAMEQAGIRDVIAIDPEFGLISGIRRFAPADAVAHFHLG